MAYRITDSCVACGTCAGECPAEAISEGDIYSIDPDKCLDCGTCAGVCPTGAIEEAWLKSIWLQAVQKDSFYFMISFIIIAVLLILLIASSRRYKKISSPFLLMLAIKGVLSFFISEFLSFIIGAIISLILIIFFTKTLYKINNLTSAIIAATILPSNINITIILSILSLILFALSFKDERFITVPACALAFSVLLTKTYYLPNYITILLSIVMILLAFFLQTEKRKNEYWYGSTW